MSPDKTTPTNIALAPIALFAYKRVDHLRRTVEALARNRFAEDSVLYAFSDGPAKDSDIAKVEEVREYLAGVAGFRSVEVVSRPRNLGLANSIIQGVTEVCGRHGRVIVIEDDMITSPFFLQYMNGALDLYEHDLDVIGVHAYVYPVRKPLPETFFLRGADCWGWATWSRGWALFNPNGASLLDQLRRANLTAQFNFKDSFDYTAMLEAQIAGKNDSWAIRWYASAFLENKLTLYPGRPLVQNIGLDSSGFHCETTNSFNVDVASEPVKLEKTSILESATARSAFEEYFRGIRPTPAAVVTQRAGRFLKAAVRPVLSRVLGRTPPSSRIQIIDPEAAPKLSAGWQAPVVAERQEAAFAGVLDDMYRGQVREDFAALASAVRAVKMDDPLLIEVGSASGWNHGVLEFLLKRQLRYIALDYSQAMVMLGKKARTRTSFVAGDATSLPFAEKACDILVLGTVLMHVLGYDAAIREARRVTGRWCIVHTIPVVQRRATTVLRKDAYGSPVVEITFNERELVDRLQGSGFCIRETFESIPHSYLDSLLGERVEARTYLCETA